MNVEKLSSRRRFLEISTALARWVAASAIAKIESTA
jgi:hypothetical protein